MAKFSKNISCKQFWTNISKKPSGDLVSCHYNSVILKMSFWKSLVILEIFVDKLLKNYVL